MRTFRTLAVERLEERRLLAGNVTASVVNGNLVVSGDSASNDVVIAQTPSGIVVLGQPGTTINGGASFTAVGVTGDVRVTLGGGNDTLQAAVAVPRDLTIDLGSGDDAVTFGGFFEPPVPDATESTVHVGGNL